MNKTNELLKTLDKPADFKKKVKDILNHKALEHIEAKKKDVAQKMFKEESDETQYGSLFFAQEHEAEEWVDMIDEKGPQAVISELMNIVDPTAEDYGGRYNEEPWGRDDRIEYWDEDPSIVLSWNPRIPTIGLTKIYNGE